MSEAKSLVAWQNMLLGLKYGGYEITKCKGAGGMGVVYEAVNTAMGDHKAAIKVLKEGSTQEEAERFIREAKGQLKLVEEGVPNVGKIYDMYFDEEDDKHPPAIIMEFITGVPLNEFQEQWKEDGLADDIDFIISQLVLVRDLVNTMAQAHALGIIHRDLKPENIMILNPHEPKGRLQFKIIDFGLCKMSEKESGVTKTHSGIGTPRWMSPEQFGNLKHTGRLADIYSSGLILHQALNDGVHLFDDVPQEGDPAAQMGECLGLLNNHSFLREKLKDFFPPARRVVLRSTQYDPRDRYQGMHEFEGALNLLLESYQDLKEGAYEEYFMISRAAELAPDFERTPSQVEIAETHPSTVKTSEKPGTNVRPASVPKPLKLKHKIVMVSLLIGMIGMLFANFYQYGISHDEDVSLPQVAKVQRDAAVPNPDVVIKSTVVVDATDDASAPAVKVVAPVLSLHEKLFTEQEAWCRANDEMTLKYPTMWTYPLYCHVRNLRKLRRDRSKHEATILLAQHLFKKYCTDNKRRKSLEKALDKTCYGLLEAYKNTLKFIMEYDKKAFFAHSKWRPYRYYNSRSK